MWELVLAEFSFVTNFKLLTGSFGTRSATGPYNQTYSRTQYDHYDKADAWYTHEVGENIMFNGWRVDANNIHPTHGLPTAVHTYTVLVLMGNGCKLGLRQQWTPRERSLSKSINCMMPHQLREIVNQQQHTQHKEKWFQRQNTMYLPV